uniref:Uncharacterized protein n=1 Tax=Rhizophagus irregularis (strain DAOM 181602 / DAOM 197198 / MUCL 43194) TaxID=747089 RepID=U9UTY3_RHIID
MKSRNLHCRYGLCFHQNSCYDVELKDWVKSLTGDATSLLYVKMAITCAMVYASIRTRV